jgi:hypothetical protein
VPQHTSRVFEHADVSGNIGSVVLDHGPPAVVPRIGKESAQLGEAGEAPVALVGREAVVGGVGDVHAGVLGVPEDEHELDTGVPVLGHLLLLVCLLEVERGKVYVVAVGEEEDAPGMASALKDGAMLAAGEGAPVSDLPGVVGFGSSFLVGGLGHVLFEKGIVLVGARQRVSVDLIHLVVRVGSDDGHVVLLVELAVDEHVVAKLWGCGQLSDDRQGGASNVPGPWWQQRGVLAGRTGGAGRQKRVQGQRAQSRSGVQGQ